MSPLTTTRGQTHHSSSSSSSPVSDDTRQPLTVVHYQCNPNLSTSFIQHEHLGRQEPLHIWVESPCACPNGCAVGDLGVGTIFLILLSLSAATYFILGSCCSFRSLLSEFVLDLLCVLGAGSCALRPFRSSSGVQMSPEASVWCMMFYRCAPAEQRVPR